MTKTVRPDGRRTNRRGAGWPLALRLYVLGAVSLGASALVGGGSLLADPSGAGLDMPPNLLAPTPFRDFFVPGFVLFAAFGVGSFVVVYGITRRRGWAWPAAVALGGGQVAWILVEALLLRDIYPLHLVYGVLGAALVALAVAPATRDALRPRRADAPPDAALDPPHAHSRTATNRRRR